MGLAYGFSPHMAPASDPPIPSFLLSASLHETGSMLIPISSLRRSFLVSERIDPGFLKTDLFFSVTDDDMVDQFDPKQVSRLFYLSRDMRVLPTSFQTAGRVVVEADDSGGIVQYGVLEHLPYLDMTAAHPAHCHDLQSQRGHLRIQGPFHKKRPRLTAYL